MKLGQFFVNHQAAWLKEPLTYELDREDSERAEPGALFDLPFGKVKTTGIFLGLLDHTDLEPDCLKKAQLRQDRLRIPQDLVLLAQWLCQTYDCSVGDALTCILTGPVLKDLKPKSAGTPRSRRLSTTVLPTSTKAPDLTAEQRAAVHSGLQQKRLGQAALLFGITGSGKTEIYLDWVERTLAVGQSAIVLVPEIALTAQAIERYQGRLGDTVAVLHSHLSDGERRQAWQRLLVGDCQVALGTRSAVFAPLANIGLVVLDEEHDTSYKQESSPRYHARAVAQQRLLLQRKLQQRADGDFLEAHSNAGRLLVVGSATPSLESLHNSRLYPSAFPQIVLCQRATGAKLPPVQLVDLRKHRLPRGFVISEPLLARLSEIAHHHHQAILLYNRRGYSHYLQCQDCGLSVQCKNCSVAMVYHRSQQKLRCHYCDAISPLLDLCPGCAGHQLVYQGSGTEKLEDELAERLPQLRVIRMDKDKTSTKESHQKILGAFGRREYDVLLGTQMVAKGLDFPNVTLVGVLQADSSLNIPDFRSSERTFQLLSQVAGRAGRAQHPGHVLIQTMNPQDTCLQAVVHHDYLGWAEQELQIRQEANYPPFCRLIRILVSSPQQEKAEKYADKLASLLAEQLPADTQLLGPAPCVVEKLKGMYRYHCILKTRQVKELIEHVRKRLAQLRKVADVRVAYDPDPQSLT